MNKTRYAQTINNLSLEGISPADSAKLVTIADSLRRWYELLVGVEHGHRQLDPETGLVSWTDVFGVRRSTSNREKPLLAMLDTIRKRYPALIIAVNRDPYGPAILVQGDGTTTF